MLPQKGADVSSSSDEGGTAQRRHRGSAAKPPIVPPKEQELTDLLQRASLTIQQEREKVRRLVEENDALRQEAHRLRIGGGASSKSGKGGAASLEPPTVFLRQRLHELALENHVAVEQICVLKMKVASLESALAGQSAQRRDVGQPPQSRGRSKSAQPSGPRASSAAAAATTTPSKQQLSYASSSSRRGEAALTTTPRHLEDTVSSRQKAQTAAILLSPGGAAPTQQSSSLARAHHMDPTPCANVPQPTVAITLSPQRPASGSGQGGLLASSGSGNAVKDYNDMMLNRLRRAMAPQPSREQIGEVVHAMVHELQRQLLAHSRGAAKLHLKKMEPCVYYSEAVKKKLHLTIDSGRLVVKNGGGHVDFLEYVERNKLCSS